MEPYASALSARYQSHGITHVHIAQAPQDPLVKAYWDRILLIPITPMPKTARSAHP
jgi:hypothetical protein